MAISNFYLLCCGIGCSFVAALFALIGVVTTNWIVLCFFTDSISQVITPSNPQGNGQSSFFGGGSEEDGLMCIRLGLFKRQDEINGFTRVVNLRTEALDGAVEAAAIILILGIVVTFLSILLLAYTMVGSAKRKSSRGPTLSPQCHGKLGYALGIIGTIFFGVGILTYTIAQSDTVHNSVNFLSQTQNRLSGIVGRHFQSVPTNSPGETVMDTSLDAFENILDIFSISGIASEIKNVFSGETQDGCQNQEQQQPQDVARQANLVRSLLEDWDPKYSYSFILTWFAFIFSLASSILVGLAYYLNGSAVKVPSGSVAGQRSG